MTAYRSFPLIYKVAVMLKHRYSEQRWVEDIKVRNDYILVETNDLDRAQELVPDKVDGIEIRLKEKKSEKSEDYTVKLLLDSKDIKAFDRLYEIARATLLENTQYPWFKGIEVQHGGDYYFIRLLSRDNEHHTAVVPAFDEEKEE